MKTNSKYFALAGAFVKEKFAGVDGFDSATGNWGYEAAGAPGANAQNLQNYNSSTSRPYIIQIANANLVDTDITLWNSFSNRGIANNGNPAGITISSGMPGVTYAEMLAESETKNFQCGMVYMKVLAGSNGILDAAITLTTGASTGQKSTDPLTPDLDPNQTLTNVLVFYCDFKINGFTNWVVTMPPSTTVRYKFYNTTTVDAGRALSNNPAVKGYVAPQIGKPFQITMSPKMQAALKGIS